MSSLGTDFIANCVCSSIAVLILGVRLGSTTYLRSTFDSACVLVSVSILFLIARAVVNGFYDIYGTSVQLLVNQDTTGLTAERLSRIKTGTILNLVARILVTSFYWLQVALLLLFYTKLFQDKNRRWKHLMVFTWAFWGITYIACVLTTLLECRPLRLYWQIDPPPGQCIMAYGQLYIQGISNVILDILVLIFSYPVLTIKNRSRAQRFRLGCIYCLGCVCIIITSIRVAITKDSHSSTTVRSIWASVQALVSAAVANLPTIYGNLRLFERRKSESQARRCIPSGSHVSLHNPSYDTIHRKTFIPLEHIEHVSEKV